MARRKKIKLKSYEYLIVLVIFLVSLIISYINDSKSDYVDLDKVYVHFIDVGQGDSELIKCSSEAALIDAGSIDSSNQLMKYLELQNIDKFKYVFASHAHEDHIGGMSNVINTYNIDKFLMPNAISNTTTFDNMLDSLENKKYKITVPKIGDKYELCGGVLDVIYVGEDESNLNDTSIVLKYTLGNTTFLFTGDATSKVESSILNSDIKSDVLKVAHHGSEYSTTNNFVNVVKPKYAVISVGQDNNYNHPSDKIIKRLNEIGSTVYRTDDSGTIVMESDGNNVTVR